MLAAIYTEKHHIIYGQNLYLQHTSNTLSVTCDVNSTAQIQVYTFLVLAYSIISMPTVQYYNENNLSH
jgi:hypothetical protein